MCKNTTNQNNGQEKNNDLYNLLYSNPENVEIHNRSKKNLEDLIKIYNKKTMISFVGAGTSEPLGISDWNNLIKELQKLAKVKNFIGELPNNYEKYSEFVQEIFDFLKEKKCEKEYFNCIANKMSPSYNTTSLTLVNLILAIDTHLTTNFDNSIQYAYKFIEELSRYFQQPSLHKSCTSHFLPDFPYDKNENNKGRICYLHGNKDKNLYILKQNDYDQYYPSISLTNEPIPHLENFLSHCYRKYNIVFIGFSFRDKYVKKLFIKLAKDIESENKRIDEHYAEGGSRYASDQPRHFFVIDSEVIKEIGENILKFEEINIFPIIYQEGKHIFLQRLFEELKWEGSDNI